MPTAPKYLSVENFNSRITERDRKAIFSDLTDEQAAEWTREAILAAEDELDAAAGVRYGLPLAITSQVERIVEQLTRFALLKRKNYNFRELDERQEKMLYDRLDKISARKAHLTKQRSNVSVDDRTSVRAASPSARTAGRKSVFSRDSLKGF